MRLLFKDMLQTATLWPWLAMIPLGLFIFATRSHSVGMWLMSISAVVLWTEAAIAKVMESDYEETIDTYKTLVDQYELYLAALERINQAVYHQTNEAFLSAEHEIRSDVEVLDQLRRNMEE